MVDAFKWRGRHALLKSADLGARFEYEYFDVQHSQGMRAHGNEHWEFDDSGLMSRRDLSANDHPIAQAERPYDRVLNAIE